LTGPSKNDVIDNIDALYLGLGRLNFSDTRSLSKPPQSQLQKDSKTSCDEIQHFDIFLNRDIIYGQPNLEGVKIHYVDVQKIGDQRFDVNHWNEFMEVFVEMKFCQKRKKKIRFRFFLILSSYFLLN
jgi:hypothetical protein